MKPEMVFPLTMSKGKAGGLRLLAENPVRGAWAYRNMSSFNAAGVGSCLLATTSTGMTVSASGLKIRR